MEKGGKNTKKKEIQQEQVSVVSNMNPEYSESVLTEFEFDKKKFARIDPDASFFSVLHSLHTQSQMPSQMQGTGEASSSLSTISTASRPGASGRHVSKYGPSPQQIANMKLARKWQSHLKGKKEMWVAGQVPNQPFLRIMKYLPFTYVMSKFVSLNRDSRRLIYKSHELLHKERKIQVDLSTTTRILKRMPPHIARRLNYIEVFMRQDARRERINRLLQFFKPHRGKIRLMLECIGMDDSDREVRDNLRMFEGTPIRRLVMRKCNFQEKKTQGFVLQDVIQLSIIDSFVKFWIKDTIKVRDIVVKKSTIIYGKSSVPVFAAAKKFICQDTYIKNPEFAWRPLTDAVEELVLLNNDYYGVISFNIVYHVVASPKVFRNLKRLEFQGQVDEETFIKLLITLRNYPKLAFMRFINRGAYFNLKMVQNNGDVQSMRIFEQPQSTRLSGNSEQNSNGYKNTVTISKVNTDTSRAVMKFKVPDEDLERTIDFSYLNYQ
ncbi:hypothetical protein FGO68_gene17555 [Halteria grandinella]|uniref:Uncharacterized protein n=1 Tax=Halteria grandinella TaxID=5974 RepID=A0A8J8T6I4_HALGN|nr:hypothetical protein FGO68_gene17555 [Halteria grandinella]